MHVVFALSFFQRLRGLLARRRCWLGEHGVLAIAPCDSIHTWGMAYPIDVAFLDSRGRVLLSRRALPARARLRCPGAAFVLERPSPQARVCAAAARWPCAGDVVDMRFLPASPQGRGGTCRIGEPKTEERGA
jgi:uncharacterized membrane protein (UPF0127 family)